ncbi:MAG: hypothetical protein HC848_03590 [Limnobacter sp.]|nr:hypothetical protein [Limnobacter sp.]
MNPTLTSAWQTLTRHATEIRATHLRELLADAGRFAAFTCEAEGLLLDYTRQRVNGRTMELLQIWPRTQT